MEAKKFYREYNPERINLVPKMMKQYEGREEMLIQDLEKERRLRIRLMAETKAKEFYKIFNPEKLEILEHIMKQYEGREEFLFPDLIKKYQTNVASNRRAAQDDSSDAWFLDIYGRDVKDLESQGN